MKLSTERILTTHTGSLPRPEAVLEVLSRPEHRGAEFDGTIRDADVAKLCDLAKHKTVHVKLSAYYALGKKQPPHEELLPMIRRVLDAYGPERCMWASDSPYQVEPPNTYQASIELIRDRLTGISDGDRQWLLRKTAEKVFFA